MELPARRLILIETLRETLDCLVVKNRADTLNRISHRNPFLRSWIVNFVKAIATSRNSIHASHDAPHQSVLGYRENHILRTRRFIDASNIESCKPGRHQSLVAPDQLDCEQTRSRSPVVDVQPVSL